MKLFGVLIRWNISKINITVKLKRQWFLLFFLAYNFKIHKAFDSNKIELQDMSKIYFKIFYKNIFSEIPFTLKILFLHLMHPPNTLTQPQVLICFTITQTELLPEVCLIFSFTYFLVVDNLWIYKRHFLSILTIC